MSRLINHELQLTTEISVLGREIDEISRNGRNKVDHTLEERYLKLIDIRNRMYGTETGLDQTGITIEVPENFEALVDKHYERSLETELKALKVSEEMSEIEIEGKHLKGLIEMHQSVLVKELTIGAPQDQISFRLNAIATKEITVQKLRGKWGRLNKKKKGLELELTGIATTIQKIESETGTNVIFPDMEGDFGELTEPVIILPVVEEPETGPAKTRKAKKATGRKKAKKEKKEPETFQEKFGTDHLKGFKFCMTNPRSKYRANWKREVLWSAFNTGKNDSHILSDTTVKEVARRLFEEGMEPTTAQWNRALRAVYHCNRHGYNKGQEEI